MTEPPFTEQHYPSPPITELDIPPGSPGMYLWTLAHDLLLAEQTARRNGFLPDYWQRDTLAYCYAQASRWFNEAPVPHGADHLTIVANAVTRADACPFCLHCGGGHHPSCQVPF